MCQGPTVQIEYVQPSTESPPPNRGLDMPVLAKA